MHIYIYTRIVYMLSNTPLRVVGCTFNNIPKYGKVWFRTGTAARLARSANMSHGAVSGPNYTCIMSRRRLKYTHKTQNKTLASMRISRFCFKKRQPNTLQEEKHVPRPPSLSSQQWHFSYRHPMVPKYGCLVLNPFKPTMMHCKPPSK